MTCQSYPNQVHDPTMTSVENNTPAVSSTAKVTPVQDEVELQNITRAKDYIQRAKTIIRPAQLKEPQGNLDTTVLDEK